MNYYANFLGRLGSNGFQLTRRFGTHGNWKNKNLGSCFGANSKTALPIWPIWPNFEINGLDWQYYLAGSSKRAPRICIFSIVLGAEYWFYLKSIAIYAPAFLVYNNSILARVTFIRPNPKSKHNLQSSFSINLQTHLNCQYFWKWTNHNPMKIFSRTATAFKL